MLGPSGCGKTTTLRAIAGLEQPASGTIRIDGKAMYASAEGRDVPTEKRGVSMVFQSYAVWPHMTVFDNVAYGLKVRKLGAAEIREKVGPRARPGADAAYADRSAAKLSGGQQQRVALARAIAFSPHRAAVRRAAVQPRRQAARRDAGRAARAAAAAPTSPRSTSPTTRRRRWRSPTA
ncbi:MAG: ABC transporter ATP-binding protein [Pseudomonadota bacterium]